MDTRPFSRVGKGLGTRLTLSWVEKMPYGRFWMEKWLSGDTEMNDMLLEMLLLCTYNYGDQLGDDHYQTFGPAYIAPSVSENLARVAI